MNGLNFNKSGKKHRVLIAPLDWGLGHATRCIPLIRELLARECIVIIAATGATKAILEKEFPSLEFLSLQGYNIRYSRVGYLFPYKILFQLPRIFRIISYETQWLESIVKKHKISILISDNRPGLYNKTIPCIYITHQLNILTHNNFMAPFIRKIHYHYINKFKECWVPDAETDNGLAGKLSHVWQYPKIPVRYTGPISRFVKEDQPKKYDLLIILSGPEPQRTILEEILGRELPAFTGKVLFIRGLMLEPNNVLANGPNTEIKDHLTGPELNKAINQSSLVICRSGYSSVMDLFCMDKKAILIPTPGQTEQEYLATYLLRKGIFYSISQNGFSLDKGLAEEKAFSYKPLELNMHAYKQIIGDFLKIHPSVT